MQDFLQALLQVPTVFFTGLLGVSLLYWLLIIVGAADLNPFDGAEGAVKGAVEGALEGAFEGTAKGTAEGMGEAVASVKALSAVAELLAFLGLKRVPLTISVSLFSLFGWFLSLSTRQALDPILPGVLSALAATGVSIAGGLCITAFLTRPLGKLFEAGERSRPRTLQGRVVRVTTERVDAGFGQGEIDDGAGGILVSIRTAPGVTLRRGDEAILIEEDAALGTWLVEPHAQLLDGGRDVLADAQVLQAASGEPAAGASDVLLERRR